MKYINQYITGELFAVDAATDLLDRIESSIMRLRLFPNSGSRPTDKTLRLKGYRRVIVDSYIIFYIVDEQKKQVMIM